MNPKSLRFLISAGPTREFLDPVRYLSNRSSGKMGYAIAEVARTMSPHVTLVSGPTALTPPAGVKCVAVTSAEEMAAAVWSRFDDADICIMAAAVCDVRAKNTAGRKIKKEAIGAGIKVEPTPDILAELGRRKQSQVLIGFALETDALEENARKKLVHKRLDLIVANDVRAFDADTSCVTLLAADGTIERLKEMRKVEVARVIVKRAVRLCQTPECKRPVKKNRWTSV